MTAVDVSGTAPRTRTPRPWRQLETDAAGCRSCGLAGGRTQVVFGAGDPGADLVIVGDGPSRQDDLLGRPLLGGAGNLLDNALLDVGLSRDDVYVTTIVKCHPGSGQPGDDEVAACVPYLDEQLAHLEPRVIVTLGAFAASVLLRRPVPLERVGGVRVDLGRGVTLVPTHHPLEALRGNPQAGAALRRHVRIAKGVLDGRLPTGAHTMAQLRARSGRERA